MSVKTISLWEYRRLMELGRPLNLIDVRTPGEFARVHATGAQLMPLDDLDPAAIAAEHHNGDDSIYVLCQSGGRARKACQRLQDAGLANVYCVEGGTAAWEKMGLPVQRGGGKVISMERQVRIAAGLIVLIGVTLAWTIHPAFIAISAFVGAGLVFAGLTDLCGMAFVLGKMPWNRRSVGESRPGVCGAR
jgi:rhodanese-related sulfurtransferase